MPFSAQDIVNQTNQYRQEQGLAPLSINPTLMNAAEARAKDMAVTGDFSHSIATTTPGMQEPWGFMKKAGYNFNYAGENLATGFNTATDTMQGWQNSPTHNKNLVSPQYSDIGVAIVPGNYQGRQTYFVIQFFGNASKPVASQQPTPQPMRKPKAPAPLPQKAETPRSVSLPPEVRIPSFTNSQSTKPDLLKKRWI